MKPQTFALATAAVVGGTGLMGMIGAFRKESFEHSEEMAFTSGYGKIAGIVPTNNLFNWVRVGIGAAGLVAANDAKSARLYNRAVAGMYAAMGIMGFIPKADTMFGLMPIYGGNIALHLGTAAAELSTEKQLMKKAKKLLPIAAKNRGLRGSSTSGRSRVGRQSRRTLQ